MKIDLKNIGKIKDAEVVIDGITVIAGENNTGKSTVGKILWAIFAGFDDIDVRIRREKYEYIWRIVHKNWNVAAKASSAAIRNFLDDIDNHDYSELEKHNKIVEFLTFCGDGVLQDEKDIELLYSVINISREESVKNIVKNTVMTELSGNIVNIFSDSVFGEVTLVIKGKAFDFAFSENNDLRGDFQQFESLVHPIYIDDPFVLDEMEKRYGFALPKNVYVDHREMLKDMLTSRKKIDSVSDILNLAALDAVMKKINLVCSGRIQNSLKGYEYKLQGSDKTLSLRSLSTGLKAFVILKQLIDNGSIEYNGILILDEPEIHLHPDWQLVLAELIVLLQKEFNLHVLLNTHSPYFLNAVEAYSQKHGVDKQCRYYLTDDREGYGYVEDVTDNIELIYQKLVHPLQVLEDMDND